MRILVKIVKGTGYEERVVKDARMSSSGVSELFEYSVVLFQANLGHLAQFPIGDQP